MEQRIKRFGMMWWADVFASGTAFGGYRMARCRSKSLVWQAFVVGTVLVLSRWLATVRITCWQTCAGGTALVVLGWLAAARNDLTPDSCWCDYAGSSRVAHHRSKARVRRRVLVGLHR